MAAQKYKRGQFINPLNRNIGRRTGRNLKAGKNIRIGADGFENFDDYLSESDADVTREIHHLKNITEEESGIGSSKEEGKENEVPSSKLAVPVQSSRAESEPQSTTLSGTMSTTQSVLSQNCTADPLHRSKVGWLKNRNIGRRTGRDIKANKNIRVDVNGVEIFDDYFSESDASSFFSQSSHFNSPSSVVRKRRSQVHVATTESQHTSEREHCTHDCSAKEITQDKEEVAEENTDSGTEEGSAAEDEASENKSNDGHEVEETEDEEKLTDGDEEVVVNEEEGGTEESDEVVDGNEESGDGKEVEVEEEGGTEETDEVVDGKVESSDGEEGEDEEEGGTEESDEVVDGKEESGDGEEGEDEDENTEEELEKEEEEVKEKDRTEKVSVVNHENTESDTENEVSLDEMVCVVDNSTVKLVVPEKGAEIPSQSKTCIDVAGNKSGSITKLDIKSQPTSAVNFNRTKKRLSYSALELSAEGRKARRNRLEKANLELQDDLASSVIEKAEVASNLKKLQNAKTDGTPKKTVKNSLVHAEDNASDASASSFICLTARSKLAQTVENKTESDDESICIVEEAKVPNKTLKQGKKSKESDSHQNVSRKSVLKKGTKRPKSEMKSKKTLSDAKNRRKTSHGPLNSKLGSSVKRKTRRQTNKAERELESKQINDNNSVGLKNSISHDVYDLDMEIEDENNTVVKYNKKVGSTLSSVKSSKTNERDRSRQNVTDVTAEVDNALSRTEEASVSEGNENEVNISKGFNNNDNDKSSHKQKKRNKGQAAKLTHKGDTLTSSLNSNDNYGISTARLSTKRQGKNKSSKDKSALQDASNNTEPMTEKLRSKAITQKSGKKASQRQTKSSSSGEDSDFKDKNTSVVRSVKASQRKHKITDEENIDGHDSSANKLTKVKSTKQSNVKKETSQRQTKLSSSGEDSDFKNKNTLVKRSLRPSTKTKKVSKTARNTSRRQSKSSSSEAENTATVSGKQGVASDVIKSVKGRRRVSQRKSSTEEERFESDDQEMSPAKRTRSEDDGEVHLDELGGVTASPEVVESGNSETPRPDSVVAAPTHFGSGVSFRVSRRSEMLENVKSGYIEDSPVTRWKQPQVQMEPTTGLTPCIARPGVSRKSAGRRVTICPEENVHHDISQTDEEDSPKVGTIRPFRHSAGMSDTPLPTPNSPIHVFETTNHSSPAEDLEGSPADDKLIIPEPAPDGIRRSQRTRVKTLAWYKGERIIYDNTKQDGQMITGVQPSLEDLKWKKMWDEKRNRRKLLNQIRKSTRAEQRDKRPARKLSIHTELPKDLQATDTRDITVINPYSQEEDGVECVCKGDSRKPVGPHHGSPKKDDPYLITQLVDQPFMSAGHLTIRPKAEKPMQLVQCSAVLFNVTYGKLLVKIHETTTIIETGDTFFVPIGNTYSLRNLRADTARLFYTVYKDTGEFAEHSIHYNVIGDGTETEERKQIAN